MDLGSPSLSYKRCLFPSLDLRRGVHCDAWNSVSACVWVHLCFMPSACKSNLCSFTCLWKPVKDTLYGGLLLEVLNGSSSLSFDQALSKCRTKQHCCDVEPHTQSACAHMSGICICIACLILINFKIINFNFNFGCQAVLLVEQSFVHFTVMQYVWSHV